MGTVSQNPTYRCIDTFEKTWKRGLVANVLGRQFRCENVSAVRIEARCSFRQVLRAPLTPCL